jgi:ubiquinone/menaquinone biosynthesis C-methylase UbiE
MAGLKRAFPSYNLGMMEKKSTSHVHRTSNLDFRLMAFEFRLRDLFRPRKEVLREVGLRAGFRVLDYGCGPGSYVAIAAGLVGDQGKVYALDAHPLAIRMVENLKARRHLRNVDTILSDRETALPDGSLDVVLLYDILHDLGDPAGVMGELQRVLKPDGVLSVSDHHLEEDEIVAKVTGDGIFKLLRKGARTLTFGK